VRPSAHVAVGLVLLALVTIYTWPIAQSAIALPPDETDHQLFSWVMVTIARNLVTRPGLLLHGNAFYPAGNSLTFAEPLLVPALVAGPLSALTGNPVLAYKVTLLLFWALSGWAMYATTFWLTRDHPAAAVAAVIFTLSPPRLEYYTEFQMEMAFGIPLAVYALVRFLEEQRLRHLVGFLVAFWLQAVSVWYYAVILGVGLVALAVQYAALHWAGWRPRAVGAAVLGGAALGLALAPVAWPFFVTRRELDFERGLAAIDASRFADLATYLTTTSTWLAGLVDIDTPAETTLFVGVVALGLAGLSLGWLRREDGIPGRTERWLVAAVGFCLAVTVLAAAMGQVRLGPLRNPFSVGAVALLLLLVAKQAAEGWRRWRDGQTERRLSERQWVGVLLGTAGLAFLLSLGPIVHIADRELGEGLYAWLHPYFLPLRAIRGATRFGLLVDFALALLAGWGMKWLGARLPARRRALASAAVVLALLAEYAAAIPLPFDASPIRPRPVDALLRADPADVAVLEWPTNVPIVDSDAMFRSLAHGKRVVNGFAGFVPDFLGALSGALTEPASPFPGEAARAALRRIYPLRYLVVRVEDLAPESRPVWQGLRAAPPSMLRFRGTYGETDLYEVVPEPESGREMARWVSYDLLRSRPVAVLDLEPLVADAALEQWADLSLNDRPIRRIPLRGPGATTIALAPPYRQAAPNVLALRFGYRRAPAALDAAYRIGRTGATSPGDLRVRSAGQPYGDTGSIEVNGAELAPNRRGYNLVAVDPAGRRLGAEAFDTFADPGAADQLVGWIAALPPGTLVAGAVRDEASGRLTETAVRALAAIGVAGDLRGRYRESHAFVGVKGAPPGSALEALGPRDVVIMVGRPDARLGMKLTRFALTPARAGD
jgi:hypothetical protein